MEADNYPDDNCSDPGYGGSISDTTTLESAALNYPFEYGRRYHAYMAEKRYGLPNDIAQQDRLLRHHDLIKTRLGGRLILAPIHEHPQRILDLGTGIGLWAIEMDKYPSAEVTGLDLSPPELGESFHDEFDPPNVRYIIDDFEKEWVDTNLDLVFGRFLAGSVEDWPRLIQQSYNNIKPGGWAEFEDWDTMIYSTSLSPEDFEKSELWTFHRDTIALQESRGRNMRPSLELEKWFRQVGFENIRVEKFTIPLGPWVQDDKLEKRVGYKNLLQMLEDISGLGMTLVWGGKASRDQVELRLVDVRKDMCNCAYFKAQYDYYVVYGQKPLKDKTADK